MARPLLFPHPDNASIEELKRVARIGSSETAIRCTAIQMLMAGADRGLNSKAKNPDPEDGATDVLIDKDLSWTPGPYPATHNLY